MPDMFIKIGDIKGEAQDSGHKDEIDVLSWSWGASQPGSVHQGSGGGASKANFQDLGFTKYVDLSSAKLLKVVATGEHIPEVTLVVRKAGTKPLEYIKFTLTDCLITSVSTGGSGGEERLTENVTIQFAEFKYVYTAQKPDGTPGGVMPFAFDIKGNKVK
jgi:type VI secretion system secreted protein Hcp